MAPVRSMTEFSDSSHALHRLRCLMAAIFRHHRSSKRRTSDLVRVLLGVRRILPNMTCR